MEEYRDPDKIDSSVDLQLEMVGVILGTFTAAVVQYDRFHEFSGDFDVRMRGREQLAEIIEMKKTLGPSYDKACREIWNAQVDRTLHERERRQHYWYEGASQPGEMAGYVAEKQKWKEPQRWHSRASRSTERWRNIPASGARCMTRSARAW